MRDLVKLLGRIEKHKEKIANERDKLRIIMIDLKEAIETFDSGIEGLENGKREIEIAIDDLSKLL
jgi:hypothetical protein